MEAHQLTDVDPEHFRALIEAADASAAVEEVPPQSLASSLSRCEDELDPTAAQAQPSTPNNNPASVFSPAGETYAATGLFPTGDLGSRGMDKRRGRDTGSLYISGPCHPPQIGGRVLLSILRLVKNSKEIRHRLNPKSKLLWN